MVELSKSQKQKPSGTLRLLSGNEGKNYYYQIVVLLAGLILPLSTQAAEIAGIRLPVSSHGVNQEEIVPADVLARVNFASQQMELIRQKLDLPVVHGMPIVINAAQPREVYFQALSAYRRVSRFTFEQLRIFHPDLVKKDQSNVRTTLPYHVWLMVNRVSKQLELIAAELNISTRLTEMVADNKTTPSDVFTALINFNRQLNIMLEQPFSPDDVFQQVTLGIHYTAKLLSKYPVIDRIPRSPDYIEGKQPIDDWLMLADCFNIIREIAEIRGERILSFNIDAIDPSSVHSGDVYQVASMVVSELAHLHSIEDDISPVVPAVKSA